MSANRKTLEMVAGEPRKAAAELDALRAEVERLESEMAYMVDGYRTKSAEVARLKAALREINERARSIGRYEFPLSSTAIVVEMTKVARAALDGSTPAPRTYTEEQVRAAFGGHCNIDSDDDDACECCCWRFSNIKALLEGT